ncbi:MAG: ribosome assembly RNA-binding protein YhbY [Acutalibacteraceae bacterium]|nr:ribosome assembly RNA-binding protein YhbY [Acutalibacteraceae bacterium]
MLNSRQRAQLRGLANSMETIFQVGKSGVTENTVKQVRDALEARELIKLRTLETCPTSSRETADEIAEKTGADVVQVIGTRFVLYKESNDNKQIKLVK